MKHVIITGGSRGLGLCFVKGLLERGYRVSTCSRKPTAGLQALLSANKKRLFFQELDLATGDAQAFVDAAMEWAGDDGLYALVNNAAIAVDGILATLPRADIQRVVQTNIVGSLVMARAAARILLKQDRGGRIINVGSIVGQRGYTGLAVYSATKAAMDGMTRSLAREMGRRNITVNTIAPGYLDTEMSAQLRSEQKQQIVGRTPLRRLGKAEDVFPALEFFLSEGSSFITGHTLVVDGGVTC